MMRQTRDETTAATATGARRLAWLAWIAAAVLALMLGVAGGSKVDAFSGQCGAYDTQEQAQADYEAGLLDPEQVDYDGNGIACEELPSGGTGPVDIGVCGAYASQADAQVDFDAGLLDPMQADYDGNGIACEGGWITVGEVAESAEVVPAQPSLVGSSGNVPRGAATVVALPNTGAGQVVPVDGAHAQIASLALLAGAAVASTLAGAAVLLWVRETAA